MRNNLELSEQYIELLAPAGNFDALRAAVNAGADAVYLGGNAFGARAYAGNFDEDELLKALDYAHIRDKKIYLTINTLLKDNELEEKLYDYLLPYYKEGLDAVIVQDWGVFDLVRESFPDLDIHASTQMAVTGPYGAQTLKEMGAARVVLARELGLDDIREIDKNVDIDIECFVHGAMCYSYSGQCLLSSMAGGRSGNRGRCAQPCRMTYNGKYLMSMKDMCTLSLIPEMIEAGVNSFKIEGRMKSSEYVAGVVSVYRKHIDKCMSELEGSSRAGITGKTDKTDKAYERDIIMLSDLYNRGGFSQGYYKGGKGQEMISLSRPNHQGTRALEVVSSAFGSAICTALVPLNAGDVFEIEEDFNYTVGRDFPKGSRVELKLPKKYRIKTGRRLYRIHNKSLIDSLGQNYIAKDNKILIKGMAVLSVGCAAKLVVSRGGVSLEVEGSIVQPALKQPLTKDGVYAQLNKTNETPYAFESLEIIMDDNVFMTNGQLNELRRNTLEMMTEALCACYRRDVCTAKPLQIRQSHDADMQKNSDLPVNVMFDTLKTDDKVFSAVLACENIDGIYIEEEAYRDADALKSAVDKIHRAGKKAYISLPYVVRGKTIQRLVSAVDGFKETEADAWLIRNLETAGIFKKHFPGAKLIADAWLYSYNRRAVSAYRRQFPKIERNTAPYELDHKELASVGMYNSEITIYGSIPVMMSENCVRKTMGQCDRKNSDITVTDTKGKNFRIASRCQNCYAVMYNSSPLFLGSTGNTLLDLKPESLRIIFTDEDAKTIFEVINASKLIRKGENSDVSFKNHTSGHFCRSIL